MKKIVKQRVRAIQRAFDSKELMYKILMKTDGNTKSLSRAFSEVFSYYLCSLDKETNYSYNDIDEKMSQLIINNEINLEQRYYFQAFNGAIEKSVTKNGLDDISGLDSKIVASFSLLERELGESRFIQIGMSGGSTKQGTKSFVTADVKTAMEFATAFTPERLFYGPLGLSEYDPFPPFKVGESKVDYMMRILENRTLDRSEEDRKKIMQAGKIVCEAFGTKRPRIAIIPETEIKNLPMTDGSGWSSEVTVEHYGATYARSWTTNLNASGPLSGHGGVAILAKVKPSQFTTISVPDFFELMQIYAIEKGAQYGDLVNPNNYEILEKTNETANLPVKKQENLIQKLMDRLQKLIKNNEKNNEHNQAEGKKEYQDLRKYKFRWNR